MIEIRFHGRGGQGAVTTAELVAAAAVNEGRFSQAFPSFGPERRGAPVVAFCRSGTRSATLWACARALDGADPARLEQYGPVKEGFMAFAKGFGEMIQSGRIGDPREIHETFVRVVELPSRPARKRYICRSRG